MTVLLQCCNDVEKRMRAVLKYNNSAFQRTSTTTHTSFVNQYCSTLGYISTLIIFITMVVDELCHFVAYLRISVRRTLNLATLDRNVYLK